MSLALRAGDELHVQTLVGPSENRLRIACVGQRFTLASSVGGRTAKLGAFITEADLWAGVAEFAASQQGSSDARCKLALLLVVAGTAGRVLDSQAFGTESELWAGLADYAAGRQADLALAAGLARESDARAVGRGSQ